MDLPIASQSQIDEMNRQAAKKMQQEGIDMVEEVVEQQVEETPVQETPEQTIQAQPESSIEAELKSVKEENWKLLRQTKEKLQRELDEARELLAQRQAATKPKEEEIDLSEFGIKEDDLAEGRHLLSIKKELAALKKAREEDAKRIAMSTAEMRIKNDFPDFEKVVSYENQKKLREIDPDVADAILATGDVYKAHAMAYKMIKLLNIHRDTTYDADKLKAQQNLAKPKSLNSIAPQKTDSPLSHANAFANGLTPELKQQLVKEMFEARQNM
jgi:hypothetical protein